MLFLLMFILFQVTKICVFYGFSFSCNFNNPDSDFFLKVAKKKKKKKNSCEI